MASAAGIRLGKVFVEIGADPSKLFGTLNKLNKRIGSIGSSMASFGGKLTAIGTGLAVPFGLATRQFATFDDAIRATAAVTQATGNQLQSMNDRARQLGATTSFTAVQVASLMTELGRAGFKPDEINEMTLSVLDLARATGTEASLSAQIMAETLRQFSMGASDATRVADVLTLAANSTNNTVEGLGEALSYAGLNAAQAGMSIEDTAAILGALGNVGIKGSNAGTVLRRLVTIAGAEAQKLGEIFNISALDGLGNVRPLVDVFADIATATNDLPSGERLKKFNEAFGLLGITGAQALGGAVGDIRALQSSLQQADGAANTTAKSMDAGLGGSMRIAMSAIEGTALAIGNALAPNLQKAINFVANFATGMTAFVKQNGDAVVSFAATSASVLAFGAALIAAGKALTLLSSVMAIVLSPLGLVAAGVALIAVKSGFAEEAMDGLQQTAQSVGSKISEALASGDFEKAWIYAIAAVEEALLRMRSAFERAIQRPINLAAIRVAESGTVTQLEQRLVPLRGRSNIRSKDSFGALRDLQNATTREQFDAARQRATAAAADVRGKGFEDPARALEEMVNLVQSRLTQAGVLGDNALESGIADITAKAEAKIAALDAKRAERAAAEAARPQMGEMGPAMPAAAAAAAASPGGGLEAPPWLQAMVDEERKRREADAAAAKLAEEQRAALASQSEAVGTFSSVGLGGLGFGGNLQQRIADAAERTAKATEEIAAGGGGEIEP